MNAQQAVELVAWRRQVEDWRQEKDDFFRDRGESPLAPVYRRRFQGLAYFPPNPAWRLRARVVRDPGRALVKLVPSRGLQADHFLRYAQATVRLPDGSEETVGLYARPHHHNGHAAHEPDELFLPFRDALAGDQTYSAGRYLEVSNPLEEGQAEAQTVIDLNYAYNPFCAYNDGYVCPLPPEENWLKSAVPAGEKVPPFRRRVAPPQPAGGPSR